MPPNLQADIYALIDSIRQRPEMYLRVKSVLEIETMLYGYSAALKSHGIQESGTAFHRKFSDYLAQRFGWGLSCGWAFAIGDHYPSPLEAFDRFFDLVNEFRKTPPIVAGKLSC